MHRVLLPTALALSACHPQSSPVAAPTVDVREAPPMLVASDPTPAPPVARAPTEPADAIKRLPCSEEKLLHSGPSERSLDISFMNASPDPVVMYWLDFDGARVHYANLEPRQGYRQQTYVTHPWLVASTRGKCLGIFLPVREEGNPVVFVGR